MQRNKGIYNRFYKCAKKFLNLQKKLQLFIQFRIYNQNYPKISQFLFLGLLQKIRFRFDFVFHLDNYMDDFPDLDIHICCIKYINKYIAVVPCSPSFSLPQSNIQLFLSELAVVSLNLFAG